MNAKGWLMLAGVFVIAVALVIFWPRDPLQGVETVAIAGPNIAFPDYKNGPSLDSVFDGLEIALDERRIRIVTDSSEADAVITIEPQEADIHISGEGLEARVRCLVTREDGRRYTMYLYVKLDEQGFTARLESRKFWEFWK